MTMENRVIKFKVWNPNYGTMHGPFTIQEMTTIKCDSYNGVRVMEVSYPPESVFLQFTGLHDKNGKEIYEGDLVAEIDDIKELAEWGKPLVVEFGQFISIKDSWDLTSNTTGFFLRYADNEITGIHDQEDGYGLRACNLLVFGNIYQHKHLLE